MWAGLDGPVPQELGHPMQNSPVGDSVKCPATQATRESWVGTLGPSAGAVPTTGSSYPTQVATGTPTHHGVLSQALQADGAVSTQVG